MKSFFLTLFCSLYFFSCTDPNIIGLDFQSPSDQIIISESDSLLSFDIITESEDSIRSDEATSLILGEVNDPIFGYNVGTFITQLLLEENNIDLGEDIMITDSVVLSYSYSGYYGDLQDFNSIDVVQLQEDINKDSIYYSNSFNVVPASMNWVESFYLSPDTSSSPMLKINLNKSFGQNILDLSADGYLADNTTFLTQFKGIGLYASSQNTMLYLNPSGSNSRFSIYYHTQSNPDSVLTLNLALDGDAARVSLFNNKNSIINNLLDSNKVYIQSMAGYKAKILLKNLDVLKDTLSGKAINRVTMSLNPVDNLDYPSHEKLFLVRVNENNENIFLTDYIAEGEVHFGGTLEGDEYTFNITRFFHQLMNDPEYTNQLYLLAAGAAVNANRTIIDAQQIKITILYSEL